MRGHDEQSLWHRWEGGGRIQAKGIGVLEDAWNIKKKFAEYISIDLAAL